MLKMKAIFIFLSVRSRMYIYQLFVLQMCVCMKTMQGLLSYMSSYMTTIIHGGDND